MSDRAGSRQSQRSERTESGGAIVGTWNCIACTFANELAKAKCLVCGTARGTSSRKSSLQKSAAMDQEAELKRIKQQKEQEAIEAVRISSAVVEREEREANSKKKKRSYQKSTEKTTTVQTDPANKKISRDKRNKSRKSKFADPIHYDALGIDGRIISITAYHKVSPNFGRNTVME